jgi:hypothetical protein
MSIAEAQMNVVGTSGPNSDEEMKWQKVDLFLIIAFTLELMLNLFANWLRPFLSNMWSIFDLIIVTLSLLGLVIAGLPLRLLLLLRCCRVLRIFGKLRSVVKIFSALAYSVSPMANAFFIIFVITAICALTPPRLLPKHIPQPSP